MRHTPALVPGLVLVLAFLASGLAAQPIQQSRGADARVDYASLTRIGPWDDRNYALTAADLALLAPNEEEQSDPIPAFFRVEMRRAWPELRRSGPAQYPRSALQIFEQRHGGYLIDGRLHRQVVRENGRFTVLVEPDESEGEAGEALKFLAGDVRVTSPEGAAESAIKIHPTNTNLVIAGSNGPGSGQRMFYSTNGGDSWSAAAALPLGGTCCDPTVDWKSDGSLAYAATLGSCSGAGCAIWTYRSSDGGKTWNGLEAVTPGDPRRELTTTGSDKEYLHVDKFATSPFKNNVYLTWHDNNVLQFARSTNDGHTWTKTAFSSDPRGIGSDIATDKNGRVFYVWPAFDSRQIVLKKSTDGGATFAAGTTVIAATEASFAFPIPAMSSREAFVYTSIDADLTAGPFANSIYVAWTDSTAPTGSTASSNHARIRVAASRDAGATWTVVTPHETADQATVDRFHPWIAVGADGTIHLAFYDTRRSASRTGVDLFYAASVDGGANWSAPIRLTSQISPKIADAFEFGDYNGLDAVMNDVIAIFTDNRQESGGSGDSVDVYAAGRSGGGLPTVSITAPASGSSFAQGASISFAGTATDSADGSLTSGLAWTSSLDGAIGAGGAFSTSTLSAGTHTVTAAVTDSDGMTGSSSIAVTVTSGGGGGCTGAALDERFESGASGWTTGGLWHIATNSACASPGYASPTHAMYFGQDGACDYATGARVQGDLVSPQISGLTPTSKLSFQHFRQVEKTVNSAFETVSVLVSVVGQAGATSLWSKTSLETSENAWTASGDLSLATFAGKTIRLTFRFDSVDEIDNDFVGWLVDDVAVTGCAGGSGADSIFADGFESGSTGAWSSSLP